MPRYSAVHQSTKGPGDARPTALQIIKDENMENMLSGKVVLITGCSSGIGVPTARALYQTGATLYLTARDLGKARKALGDISSNPRVHFLHLELDSLESVRACAAEFKSQSTRLDILIMNAGVMACPEGRTVDGFETQFGTNYLAHFLLFQLLKSLMLASAAPGSNSRVVVVSSRAHCYSSIHFDNIALQGEYAPWISYGQSKTAGIWMANEIDRRYGSKGLRSFSLHPGGIQTELLRHLSDETKASMAENAVLQNYLKNPEQGAATSVWAAVAKELEGQGGKYLDNCQIADAHNPKLGEYSPGYAPWAYDPEGEARLWRQSLEMLGLNSALD